MSLRDALHIPLREVTDEAALLRVEGDPGPERGRDGVEIHSVLAQSLAAAVEGGVNALGVVVTLLVLALLGFGVFGALWSRPPDE